MGRKKHKHFILSPAEDFILGLNHTLTSGPWHQLVLSLELASALTYIDLIHPHFIFLKAQKLFPQRNLLCLFMMGFSLQAGPCSRPLLFCFIYLLIYLFAHNYHYLMLYYLLYKHFVFFIFVSPVLKLCLAHRSIGSMV